MNCLLIQAPAVAAVYGIWSMITYDDATANSPFSYRGSDCESPVSGGSNGRSVIASCTGRIVYRDGAVNVGPIRFRNITFTPDPDPNQDKDNSGSGSNSSSGSGSGSGSNSGSGSGDSNGSGGNFTGGGGSNNAPPPPPPPPAPTPSPPPPTPTPTPSDTPADSCLLHPEDNKHSLAKLADALANFLPSSPDNVRLPTIIENLSGEQTLASNLAIELYSSAWQYLAIIAFVKFYKLIPGKGT